MNVVIHEAAWADLDHIYEWIAKDNPAAAAKVIGGIRDKVNLLELDSLARMGRPGRAEGTRELIEHPYIIVYEVDERSRLITVVAIVHGARNRQDSGFLS
jgi:addiction module RelE/StbE family toxin